MPPSIFPPTHPPLYDRSLKMFIINTIRAIWDKTFIWQKIIKMPPSKNVFVCVMCTYGLSLTFYWTRSLTCTVLKQFYEIRSYQNYSMPATSSSFILPNLSATKYRFNSFDIRSVIPTTRTWDTVCSVKCSPTTPIAFVSDASYLCHSITARRTHP